MAERAETPEPRNPEADAPGEPKTPYRGVIAARRKPGLTHALTASRLAQVKSRASVSAAQRSSLAREKRERTSQFLQRVRERRPALQPGRPARPTRSASSWGQMDMTLSNGAALSAANAFPAELPAPPFEQASTPRQTSPPRQVSSPQQASSPEVQSLPPLPSGESDFAKRMRQASSSKKPVQPQQARRTDPRTRTYSRVEESPRSSPPEPTNLPPDPAAQLHPVQKPAEQKRRQPEDPGQAFPDPAPADAPGETQPTRRPVEIKGPAARAEAPPRGERNQPSPPVVRRQAETRPAETRPDSPPKKASQQTEQPTPDSSGPKPARQQPLPARQAQPASPQPPAPQEQNARAPQAGSTPAQPPEAPATPTEMPLHRPPAHPQPDQQEPAQAKPQNTTTRNEPAQPAVPASPLPTRKPARQPASPTDSIPLQPPAGSETSVQDPTATRPLLSRPAFMPLSRQKAPVPRPVRSLPLNYVQRALEKPTALQRTAPRRQDAPRVAAAELPVRQDPGETPPTVHLPRPAAQQSTAQPPARQTPEAPARTPQPGAKAPVVMPPAVPPAAIQPHTHALPTVRPARISLKAGVLTQPVQQVLLSPPQRTGILSPLAGLQPPPARLRSASGRGGYRAATPTVNRMVDRTAPSAPGVAAFSAHTHAPVPAAPPRRTPSGLPVGREHILVYRPQVKASAPAQAAEALFPQALAASPQRAQPPRQAQSAAPHGASAIAAAASPFTARQAMAAPLPQAQTPIGTENVIRRQVESPVPPPPAPRESMPVVRRAQEDSPAPQESTSPPVESAPTQEAQPQPSEPQVFEWKAPEPEPAPPPDLALLARRVFPLVRRLLEIEKERSSGSRF